MLLAAVVWLIGVFATQWHELVVPHARCPEHGELLELVPGEQGRDPEIAAAPSDPHHDACAFHAVGSTRLVTVHVPILAPELAPGDDVPLLASVRLPARTLRFAPKTSPPTA